ncbi:MAG: hypothetical protein ACYTAF_11950, partial [Planctomycetota bacterium]
MLTFDHSPVPGSFFLRALPRATPRLPVAEVFVCLALGAAVGHRFGPVGGLLAILLEAGLLYTARRAPAHAVAFLLIAFALPKLETVQEAAFYLRIEDFAIAALCITALRRRAAPPATPLDVPVTLYAGALGLTCLTGLALGTIAAPVQSTMTVLKLVELMCGFFAAAWVIRDDAARRTLAHAVLVAVGILGAAAILFLALDPGARPFNRHPYL